MVSNWSMNPVEIRTRESEVSMSTRKQAEELLEKLDKFILFRTAKSIDRTIVKKEKGTLQENRPTYTIDMKKMNYVLKMIMEK